MPTPRPPEPRPAPRRRPPRRPFRLAVPSAAAAAALALSLGCRGAGPVAERGCPDCPLPTTDPAAVAAAACPDWQWVGVTGGPACPRIPGWEVTEILEVAPAADGAGAGAGDRRGTGGEPIRQERLLPTETEGGGAGRDPIAQQRRLPPSETDPTAKLPPSEPRNAGLRRYCRYTDRGRGTVATLLAEGARQGLDPLDRDCMAVVPLGAAAAGAPDAETRSWREIERVFLARAGRATAPAAGAGPVRLVVIDTAAHREVHGEPPWRAPANSPHGVTLANAAKRLTCRGNDEAAGGDDCAGLEVEAELALAYVDFDRFSAAGSVRDEVAGGYVGTMSDLAEAIGRAAGRPGPRRRVLNLSVGWNGYLFGGLEDDPADMPAPVRAVLDALGDATARGALVVAAAGNRNRGPVAALDVGPMLPAGWAVRPGAGGGPLLEAAGGLAFEAFTSPPGYRQLANARFRAVPRVLAFADHAVVERHRRDGGTATLTGTSVASLVVAAGAAASWLYLPDESAGTVLARVVDSGEPAGVAADFCLGGSLAVPDADLRSPRGVLPRPDCPAATAARRVRYCAAVAAACRAAGAGGCPQCGPEDVPPPEVDHDGLDRFARVRAVSLGDRVALSPPDHERCPPEATLRELAGMAAADDRLRGGQSPAPPRERFFPGADPGAVRFRCPYWQFPSLGAVPWVDPAPESTPCATCNFEPGSPATVYIDLDPLFQGRPSSPVLLVGDRAYALDWDPARQSRAIVEDVEYHDGEDVLISFALDSGLSAVSPLLRVR